jgi:hypothetical protein
MATDHAASPPTGPHPCRVVPARVRRGEHALVTRRLPRTLQRIERDLTGSDPGLDALFRSFARRTGGCDMSWVEKVGRKRFLLFGRRRRQRTLIERMKDWSAGNWTDP